MRFPSRHSPSYLPAARTGVSLCASPLSLSRCVGVLTPLSIGPCVGAVAVLYVLTPLALVPASRPHRRQSPPAAPLPSGGVSRTFFHRAMCWCRDRCVSHHATRPRTCQKHAQASSPPPQTLCARLGARTFLHCSSRCPCHGTPPGCSSRLDRCPSLALPAVPLALMALPPSLSQRSTNFF